MATKIAAKKASLIGVRKGVATSIATICVPCGNFASSGAASRL